MSPELASHLRPKLQALCRPTWSSRLQAFTNDALSCLRVLLCNFEMKWQQARTASEAELVTGVFMPSVNLSPTRPSCVACLQTRLVWVLITSVPTIIAIQVSLGAETLRFLASRETRPCRSAPVRGKIICSRRCLTAGHRPFSLRPPPVMTDALTSLPATGAPITCNPPGLTQHDPSAAVRAALLPLPLTSRLP